MAAPRQSDILVYGCTSGAITAAIQARRMGKSVVMVCPEKHLGGLTAGGLGWTDSGDKAVIGGLSREFYHRIWQHYQKAEAWRWQKREEYGNKGQGTEALDKTGRTMWIFEPHVAERVHEAWIKEMGIPVVRNAWLDREKGVRKQGSRIVSIATLDGTAYSAKVFIDATYEGDLMAAAGVAYHVGRESTRTYGERWNGVQTGVLHHRHHFGAVKYRPECYAWLRSERGTHLRNGEAETLCRARSAKKRQNLDSMHRFGKNSANSTARSDSGFEVVHEAILLLEVGCAAKCGTVPSVWFLTRRRRCFQDCVHRVCRAVS